MKKINSGLLSGIVMLLFLFASCAKDGDTGPQGPAGPAGQNGTDGTNGQDGNANVNSISFTVQTWEWANFGTVGQPGHLIYHEHNIPEITQDVMNDGMILVYKKYYGPDGMYLLPWTIAAGSVDVIFSTYFEVGKCGIDIARSDLGTYSPTAPMDFKCVVVDGSARAMNPDLNWNDYNQIADRFNLE